MLIFKLNARGNQIYWSQRTEPDWDINIVEYSSKRAIPFEKFVFIWKWLSLLSAFVLYCRIKPVNYATVCFLLPHCAELVHNAHDTHNSAQPLHDILQTHIQKLASLFLSLWSTSTYFQPLLVEYDMYALWVSSSNMPNKWTQISNHIRKYFSTMPLHITIIMII